MSMEYYDQNGHVSHGPTNTDMTELLDWSVGEDVPQLEAFLEDGETEEPAKLAAELAKVNVADIDHDVELVLRQLQAAAAKAVGVLILSDE